MSGRLAILWHLHQPDYRHPASGAPVMPWVRLHSLRGYRDLVLDVVRDDVPCTINVVPSLLDQMLGYAQGRTDRHLELTRRSAAALPSSERDEILETFVSGHPVMRQAHEGYRALEGRIANGERLSEDDLLDLQVWSTLAWFGATALRDFPELAELRRKGRGFDEDDKKAMLAAQDAILGTFPDLFRKIGQDGNAARLSVSPYFHPILPLLVDARHARRSLPHVPDDALFAFPEDALAQMVNARARVKELFGFEPAGMWPSEGAVSPEVVALAAQAGFSWLASDDEVLRRSVRDGLGTTGGWDLGHGVTGFFRDHDLSDRIGFVYAHREARVAVDDLLGTAARRADGRTLLVALDGENPWEVWPGAGDDFRRLLHEGLRTGPIRGVTLDEAATEPHAGRVRALHTGSWIGANLAIWYGQEDDRWAWGQVGAARRAIAAAPEALRAKALDKLLPAEGSDWTWWYGTEFGSSFDGTFDELFRAHVRAAWEALGRTPPADLYRPVRDHAASSVMAPRRPLRPKLVEAPPWIHWSGAGRVRWAAGSSMAHALAHATGLQFGWSPPEPDRPEGCLWLRVDLPPILPDEGEGARWVLHVADRTIDVPYGEPGAVGEAPGLRALHGPRVLVASVDAATLPAGDVSFRVEVIGRGTTVYPSHGEVVLPRPGLLEAWKV